jgi:hypothetical protein
MFYIRLAQVWLSIEAGLVVATLPVDGAVSIS